MPSQSKSQQHLMGMVHAVQTGKMKSPSKKISKLAKSMTKKSAKEFASTKTKGLPTKKKVVKENYDNAIGTIHTVLKPYPGCTPDNMVKQIDPIMGAQHHGIDHQTIHGIYPTQDEAKKVAEDIHKQYEGDMKKLEEKKDSVAKKLTTTIDKLEKKRKDHIKAAKENPKTASEHKDHISAISSQIENLMSKLEKVSKSKKEDESEEDEDRKKKVNENAEVSKYKVGDIVIPNKGPHKGQKHKVIHAGVGGKYNIKPIPRFPGDKNQYEQGAVSASEEDLSAHMDEASINLSAEQKMVESFVKRIAKEFGYSSKDAAKFIVDTIKKLDLK